MYLLACMIWQSSQKAVEDLQKAQLEKVKMLSMLLFNFISLLIFDLWNDS